MSQEEKISITDRPGETSMEAGESDPDPGQKATEDDPLIELSSSDHSPNHPLTPGTQVGPDEPAALGLIVKEFDVLLNDPGPKRETGLMDKLASNPFDIFAVKSCGEIQEFIDETIGRRYGVQFGIKWVRGIGFYDPFRSKGPPIESQGQGIEKEDAPIDPKPVEAPDESKVDPKPFDAPEGEDQRIDKDDLPIEIKADPMPVDAPIEIKIDPKPLETEDLGRTWNREDAQNMEATLGNISSIHSGFIKEEDVRRSLRKVKVHMNQYWEYEMEDFVWWDVMPARGTIRASTSTTYSDFELCNVNGPGSFYLRSLSEVAALEDLEQKMTDWYKVYFWSKYREECSSMEELRGLLTQVLKYLSLPVKKGGIYAGYVTSMHKWVRCTAEEVEGFGEGKEVLIQLLDHGTQALVAHFMILPLRRAFLDFLIQAYAGKCHEEPTAWTNEERREFRERTEGQKFWVQIMKSEESETKVFTRLTVLLAAKLDADGN